MSTKPKSSSVGVDIFIGLLILGFIAGGVGALNSYFQQRAENAAIAKEGVELEASVIAVTEHARVRGGGGGISLTISYDPPGAAGVEIATVTVCSEADYEEGTETVEIVYAADDPEAVRLAECESSIDSSLPLFIGIIFLALGLFFLWGFVRSFMKRRET